jgi:SP family general alpha glucoside:H+ symporter-like MFS transporter
MSYAHDEEGGPGRTGRHMSVSHYADNMGAPAYDTTRRRSSIVPADVAGITQGEAVFNQRDDTLRKMSVAVPNLAELTADARNAAEHEHKMGFREGCRLYPKAIMFSFCLSLAVIMEGYDTYLLGNFFGNPAFNRKYGSYAGLKDGVATYQLSATWQSALTNGSAAAQIIGLFINGIVSERIGYRWTMIAALLFITACIFVTFFAVNIRMLLAGYVLSGLPWGVL